MSEICSLQQSRNSILSGIWVFILIVLMPENAYEINVLSPSFANLPIIGILVLGIFPSV